MANYEITADERHLQNLSSSQIEGGYILKDEASFRHWETLLDKWIDSIKKFCSETKDAPYVDNEMGNVGLLMAAAWKVNGIAVCEKLVEVKSKDGRDKKGRLDLWMKLPKSEIEELIEAKHTYHLVKKKKDGNDDKYDYEVLKKKVIERARSLIIKSNQRAVAMVFLTHYIGGDEPENREGKIKSLIGEKRLHDGWDIVAWCFPEEMRNKDYPGVILSAKYVQTP